MTHPLSRRGFLVTLSTLPAAVLLGCSSDDADDVPSTTTTSTTTSTSTTTTLPPLDVSVTQTTIATAVVPMVSVLRDLPADAVTDLRATEAGAVLAAQLPVRSALRPNSDPIPTINAPVIGRRATESGWEFDHPTPWGFALTFVVTEQHGDWLRVMFPVRPNGQLGWVHTSQVALSTIESHVWVSLSERRLKAIVNGAVIADTPVVIGSEATPTPTGRLYLTDFDPKSASSSYGPWVAPLSGYSEALDEFSGGVPVIAIHGTNNPGIVGQARSNGCIRVPNEVIEVLRKGLPLGTPVDIWP